MSPWALVFIGLLLSLLGTVLPFLMVIHIVPSTFFLDFFSVASMIAGLALGIGGAGQYVRGKKK